MYQPVWSASVLLSPQPLPVITRQLERWDHIKVKLELEFLGNSSLNMNVRNHAKCQLVNLLLQEIVVEVMINSEKVNVIC